MPIAAASSVADNDNTAKIVFDIKSEGVQPIGTNSQMNKVGVIARSALLFVVLAVAVDQLLLYALRNKMSDADAWRKSTYAAYAASHDAHRPQFIVIGSSRAEEIAPADMMQRLIDRRGLPYQAVNLAIGGGGTPAMLLAAMETFTPFVFHLPPGSRVVYVFSYFEMNHLKVRSMKSLPVGFHLLARFGQIDPTGWAYRLAGNSGFARATAYRYWQQILPKWVARMIDETTTPFNPQRVAPQSCNVGGRYHYQILPINDWSLQQLAKKLGNKLVIVLAPVSQRQQVEDERFGLTKIGGAYLTRFIARTGIKYNSLSSFRMPDGAFRDRCDHVGSREEKERFLNRILDVVL